MSDIGGIEMALDSTGYVRHCGEHEHWILIVVAENDNYMPHELERLRANVLWFKTSNDNER
jgi:hypothetical protein